MSRIIQRAAILLLALLLLFAAVPERSQPTRMQMIQFTYISQACELMGRFQVTWFKQWPPKGPKDRVYRVQSDVGPARACGVTVFMPTRTDERGRIAATSFLMAKDDTTERQHRIRIEDE